MIIRDRHFDQANTNTIIKLLFCAGEIRWAFVLMLNTCTTAQRISPPPLYAFKLIQPEGGIEMTMLAGD